MNTWLLRISSADLDYRRCCRHTGAGRRAVDRVPAYVARVARERGGQTPRVLIGVIRRVMVANTTGCDWSGRLGWRYETTTTDPLKSRRSDVRSRLVDSQ